MLRSNLHLLHWQEDSLPLSYLGSPYVSMYLPPIEFELLTYVHPIILMVLLI